RGELAEMADGALLRAGYVRVGFDHYAKPDNGLAVAVRERRLRRNFQGFTEDAAEAVIGFGASAVSFVGGLYAQNHKTVGGYEAAVAARRLATERGAVRTPYDEVVARTITDLLCRFEVDVSDLLAQAPGGDVARIDAALEDFQATGVVDREGARLRLNPDAYGLARAVAMALDPYAHGQQSFAKAV
ncbi:MAG: coproporphyrinogen III oxidase, partial [Pseudomonadota bacterium]